MRIAFLYIYTTISYLILYPFTFINVLIILTLNVFKLEKAIRAILRFWARGTFIIVGKSFKLEGKEHIDKNRKYILMANHASMFDIMAVMAICPSVSWFGRAHLLNIPIFGTFLKAINYIPMKSTDLRNTKQMVGQLINKTKNQTVAIFPEGTRTVNGEMNNFRRGFLHVLKASKLDILPVSLIGFFEFKPKDRFYFEYSKKLSAKIHKPIAYSELEKLNDKEIIRTVQSKIESALIP